MEEVLYHIIYAIFLVICALLVQNILLNLTLKNCQARIFTSTYDYYFENKKSNHKKSILYKDSSDNYHLFINNQDVGLVIKYVCTIFKSYVLTFNGYYEIKRINGKIFFVQFKDLTNKEIIAVEKYFNFDLATVSEILKDFDLYNSFLES